MLSVGLEGVYKIGRRTRIVVGEPEKSERVKGIPSSKHLAERSEYFRQKVWTLKQRALGVAEPPVLPVAVETPAECHPGAIAIGSMDSIGPADLQNDNAQDRGNA